MKRISLIVVAIVLPTFTLVACGTANEENQSEEQANINDTEKSQVNDAVDPATNADQNEMQQQMEALNYTEFELEVEYADDQAYEAKIKNEDGQLKAELEDKRTNIDIKGRVAFDEIYPIVHSLTIEQSTAKEAAIDEILQAFDLDANYEEFELEITFPDGTEIEFED